ncbi:MAG: dihydrolipoyl dehydrogenase [Gammaproteobacteria bacterium]
MFDVIVIGSGPAGYVAAIKASQLGLKTLCIEESIDSAGKINLGGTCLNVGCIPSKTLLDSSHRYYEANKNLSEHGIKIGKLELDLNSMMKRKDDIVNKLTGGISGLFSANKVQSISGRGRVTSANTVEVTKSDGSVENVESKNIIIATGSKPIEIPSAIFGENIVDSTGALSFEKVPETLGVVGAGIIGLELGSVWSRLGSKVTVIEALDEFLPMADKDISTESLKEFKKQGLDIQLSSKVIKSSEQKDSVSVSYEYKGKEVKKKFDKLIVAVGRYPNSSGVIDKTLNISVNNGFIEVNEFCQTSVSNIWAVGDVVRGPMLAHKGSEEGIMVAERIAEKHAQVNYDLVPSVIYSHPEIAWVGNNEDELKSKNISYKVGKFPFAASGRALAVDQSVGFVKVLSDKKTDTILGVHVFGPAAAEIVQQALISMEFGASSEDIALTMFSHPTVSEAFHEAALAANNQAIHIGNSSK